MKQLYINRVINTIEMLLESNLLNPVDDLRIRNLLTLVLLELKNDSR